MALQKIVTFVTGIIWINCADLPESVFTEIRNSVKQGYGKSVKDDFHGRETQNLDERKMWHLVITLAKLFRQRLLLMPPYAKYESIHNPAILIKYGSDDKP